MIDSFADHVAKSLPVGIELPPPFRIVFDWMDASSRVDVDKSGELFGKFQPIGADYVDNCAFHPNIAPEMFRHWSGNDDPTVATQLAIIMQTGGDGSHAAIWRDADGRQSFVHLGSGSGSTMVCVLTDDPVDMLRLFAIGYGELCWGKDYGETPAEVAERDDLDPAPTAPSAYANFVAETFGVTIPQRASEIVGAFAEMDDESSDDPFWRWSKSVCR